MTSEETTASPTGRLFAKKTEALAYLQARGFSVQKTKFYADCKKGLIPTDIQGRFEEAVLLAYAANLPTVAREEDLETAAAARQRLEADADHKTEQAKLARLRRLKLEGELMPRADVERDLAARAQFFRAQVENFIDLVGPRLIAAVNGDEAHLPELRALWEAQAGDWMDAWSQDREFVAGPDADSAQ